MVQRQQNSRLSTTVSHEYREDFRIGPITAHQALDDAHAFALAMSWEPSGMQIALVRPQIAKITRLHLRVYEAPSRYEAQV